MSIFTILTYAMLILVVVTGVASLPRELGIRWDRRGLKRRALQSQERRVLRPRA
jgi:hypothetical protein